MKKFLIALTLFCLVMGAMSVSAANFEQEEAISYGQTKTVTIPQPEGEVDEGYVYFTQLFVFTPEVDGTYRYLTDYEQDEAAPYDIFMDVVPFCYADDGSKIYLDNNGYLEVENGCEFEAQAGIHYELLFQYNSHDGRYPQFRFYLESDDVEIPKTGDADFLLPVGLLILAAVGIVLTTTKKKLFN